VTEDRNVLVGRGLRDDPINGAYDPRALILICAGRTTKLSIELTSSHSPVMMTERRLGDESWRL
jgi:hypothetical protein